MSDCRVIISYLTSFKADNLLYGDPIFATGLLRLLNPYARRLIFTLLVSSVHIQRLRNIPNVKESLGIILQSRLASKIEDSIVLCEAFRTALLRGFCLENLDFSIVRCNTSNLTGLELGAEDENCLITAAKKLSDIKFQSMLQSIVNSDSGLMYGIRDILIFCNLIDSMHKITRKGFEFLLNNKVDQRWIVILSSIKYFSHDNDNEMLLQLMEMCTKSGPGLFSLKKMSSWHYFLNSIGVLHIVRCADGCKAGNDLVTFKQSTEDMIIDAETFNKIERLERYCQSLDSSVSYVYLNASSLFSSENPLGVPSQKFIFLETNFKIYAYTNKDYEKSILSLFSRTSYTLPNLIKAQLDEESVVGAYYKGITAEQILKYLREFAHNVPSSVANQILIWESRLHRVTTTNGVMYADFLHISDYLRVLQFLERNNALILKDETKRIIVGTEEAHAQVKEMLDNL